MSTTGELVHSNFGKTTKPMSTNPRMLFTKDCAKCGRGLCRGLQKEGHDFCCWCVPPKYITKSPDEYFCYLCKRRHC